jgi:hypothetical protein
VFIKFPGLCINRDYCPLCQSPLRTIDVLYTPHSGRGGSVQRLCDENHVVILVWEGTENLVPLNPRRVLTVAYVLEDDYNELFPKEVYCV